MATGLGVQLAIRQELERHPGLGARRIARRLAKRGIPVSHMTVHRWRVRWGYAPALKRVGNVRRRACREDATHPAL